MLHRCTHTTLARGPVTPTLTVLIGTVGVLVGSWPNSVAYAQVRGLPTDVTGIPAPAAPPTAAAPAPTLDPSPAPSAPSAPSTPAPAPLDEKKGGSGESCTKTSDCKDNLRCVLQTCFDPNLGVEGSSCTRAADCNGQLRCMENRCTSPTAPQPSMPATPPQGAAQGSGESLDASLTSLAGLRSTLSVGYATTTLEGLDGGFTYNVSMAYKFHAFMGLTGWLGNMNVSSGGSGDSSAEATLPRYLLGLRLGNTVFVELLGGSVGITATSIEEDYTRKDSSFAIGASLGSELGPWKHFALSPSAFILYPTTDTFLGNEVLYGFMFGFTVRVPRADE